MSIFVKISELPTKITLAAANIFAVVQSGITRQVDLQAIADWVIQTAASFVQSGTGAIAIPVQDVLRHVIWAEGYGFKTSATAAANTQALTDIAARVNVLGGATVIISPGSYSITPTLGSTVCAFSSLKGLAILASGAVITDGQTYTGTNTAVLFKFTACKNIHIPRGMRIVTQQNAIAYTDFHGLSAFEFYQGCEGIDLDYEQDGGSYGVRCNKVFSDPASYVTRQIRLRIKGNRIHYPYSGQFSGDGVAVDLDLTDCGRNFFVYGATQNAISVRSKNQKSTSLIKAYNGYGCDDIKVNYVDRDSDNCNAAAPVVSIEFGDSTAAVHRKIDLTVNLKNPPADKWGNSIGFAKYSDGGSTPDSVSRGHILDGFRLSGISDNTSCAVSHVNMEAGAFAGSDVIRNVSVEDLTLLGASEAASFPLTTLAGEAVFKNVRSEHNIYTGNGTSGKVVFFGCTAANFTSGTGVTDTHDYISCNITDGTLQNIANNKKLLQTTITGVLRTFSNAVDSGALVLDWYEEGDWTPTLTFGGGSTGLTYSVQDGRYTRIGNSVRFSARVALSAKGTSTGVAVIGGLPWTLAANPNHGVVPSVALNMSGLTGALQMYASGGTTTVVLGQSSATGFVAITDARFTDTSNYQFSGWFEVA